MLIILKIAIQSSGAVLRQDGSVNPPFVADMFVVQEGRLCFHDSILVFLNTRPGLRRIRLPTLSLQQKLDCNSRSEKRVELK